jgi:hypothetical protein
VELIVADEIDVPNRSVFVPADLPDFDAALRRERKKGRPVVVIYPDGRERVIEPAGASD